MPLEAVRVVVRELPLGELPVGAPELLRGESLLDFGLGFGGRGSLLPLLGYG